MFVLYIVTGHCCVSSICPSQMSRRCVVQHFVGLRVCLCRDLTKHTMMSNPRVYVSGLKKMHLNIRKMLEWILHALVLAAVVFWIPFAVFQGSSGQWDDG